MALLWKCFPTFNFEPNCFPSFQPSIISWDARILEDFWQINYSEKKYPLQRASLRDLERKPVWKDDKFGFSFQGGLLRSWATLDTFHLSKGNWTNISRTDSNITQKYAVQYESSSWFGTWKETRNRLATNPLHPSIGQERVLGSDP